MNNFDIFVGNLVEFLIQPLINLLFALALVYFLWGLTMFILNAGDPEGQKKGKTALIWGIIGLFIMTSVLGILAVAQNTFGI
ncbi:MAG: hypothetical protein AAB439_02745 [Patescibacteria group bacterium]